MTLVLRDGQLRNIFRIESEFGQEIYDLVNVPTRLQASGNPEPLVESSIDSRRVEPLRALAALAAAEGSEGEDSWLSRSQRTLARLHASFLIAEDPQHRLNLRKAATLTHQVSLVDHILASEHLNKVLIGDEVGLGKTIEAGMVLRRLIDRNPGLRALYLAPARLVTNVAAEFRDKLDIDARVWVTGPESDARIESDRCVIASLQRASFGGNLDLVAASGPWDVIIVDECHHLSDWGAEGGKPTRAYRLVAQLLKSQPAGTRLILMSGTPHQGNETRFRNLLRLLSDDGKNVEQTAGRVIFRTKERVRDWKGDPLFPARDVREPIVVSLGSRYEAWYRRVGALYDDDAREGVAARAASWAKGQALQWAASSAQAGIGFLVRLGMRRLGWTLDEPTMVAALEALRPYRGGSVTEPLPQLYERLRRQIGARDTQEPIPEDQEDVDGEGWQPNPTILEEVLREGIELVSSGAADAKWAAAFDLIDAAGNEKIVLFAQPVETVTHVARLIHERYGQRPALIVGAQRDDVRAEMVRRFQTDNACRFLISSRAGGEGLNMQQARRLVHLDVPWNPMELEQRIGRVHRFGSRKTVIIDTVVVAGSREIDMYSQARRKLSTIARNMAPEQFEELFSRVMSLLPPRELEGILCGPEGLGGLDDPASETIGRLVSEGFSAWQRFDETYRQEAENIRRAQSGAAEWADLQVFLTRFCGASLGEPATYGNFAFSEGEIVAKDDTVPTVRWHGQAFVCGDIGGLSATGADGKAVPPLGVNHELVRMALHERFSDRTNTGVAYLHRLEGLDFLGESNEQFSIHVFLRQALRFEAGRWNEIGVTLHCLVAQPGQPEVELDASQRAALVRAAANAARIRDPRLVEHAPTAAVERGLVERLARRCPETVASQVRYAVWPVAILVVGTASVMSGMPTRATATAGAF